MATEQWKKENYNHTIQYSKDWYAKHREYKKQKVIERRRESRKWYEEYKFTLKCKKCGMNHPACLTFHHRDAKEKELAISRAISSACWCKERVLKEIAKCDVLCFNCHFILHYDEKNDLL